MGLTGRGTTRERRDGDMKILIWLGCLLITWIIHGLLPLVGLEGPLPTLVYALGLFVLAMELCKKWDDHQKKPPKDDQNPPSDPPDPLA